MLVAFIIGTIIFAISVLLGLFGLLGGFFKNVGTNNSISSSLFLIFFSCFIYAAELAIFKYSPYAWGIAFILMIIGLCVPVLDYITLENAAVFTKKNIYRLTKFLTFKKYSYDDVIGYVMKKTACTDYHYGPRTIYTYDVEIYLNDYSLISFCTSRESDRKIKYLKQLLQDHHCHRNGRFPKKRGLPFTFLS